MFKKLWTTIVMLLVALIAMPALLASPAQAVAPPLAPVHVTPDTPGWLDPSAPAENRATVQVGTHRITVSNGVLPYMRYGQHYADMVNLFYFQGDANRSLTVRTTTYCVENRFGQTVASAMWGGTQHGPAYGGGYFSVRDPWYLAGGEGVHHCRVYQWNTLIVEREAGTGKETARYLMILQDRTF